MSASVASIQPVSARGGACRRSVADAITRYLKVKRALGCRFNTEERSLRLFHRFLLEQSITRADRITSECVDRFLASRPHLEPRSFNELLGCVRRLFEWLVNQDELDVSPVKTPPRRVTGRRLPYLFEPEILRELLRRAERLPDESRCPQRGPTQSMIFALLATLGLRIGEVSRLTCGDVDLDHETLLIRNSKFGKSRVVPIGPRLGARLQAYLVLREQRLGAASPDAPLFSWQGREPVHPNSIRRTFRDHLLPHLALTIPPGTSRPLRAWASSFICRAITPALVSRRARSNGTPEPSIDISRPCQPKQHCRIPDDHQRVARSGQRTLRGICNSIVRGGATMNASTLGSLMHEFFLSYLVEQKGLRQGSVRSYRDTLRLFLQFVAAEARRDVSKLTPEDLSFERVLAFLRHLEQQRRNSVTTRNQRLAALHTFFEFVARRDVDRLHECQQIAMIPVKRSTQPSMRSLTREEVQALFAELPRDGRLSLRDRALLLFFYNTGARVQEVADLRVEQLALERPAHVRLFGKGGKWRHCPLWNETASILRRLIEEHRREPQASVFRSAKGAPLTRFGLYKRVRRLTAGLPPRSSTARNAHISPHVFRRTAAVHLLEAGVDVNVIRGWRGNSSLATTNRYAEITTRMKAEALRLCEIPATGGRHTGPAAWRGEASLLDWLGSL